ncbi:gamma-glutamyl-gamma-aminobutyrate hydrolase family protein [Rhodococcus pseudokoreensis]|uniref:Gamma-glutamyl-gamma-aminobutyrate hydrolase family protein n=2 Tax=Rhodococcus pseudokoreensis TaxID=2811421 RepID=A0A974ZRX4_9NOCA|nr:gamma-glutamyl-gamma-aminobutyrate hydrolase family protein [Rhodococcus pseudokoreensis]QSE88135.1 gamma-glutamyl-gamma-aminobutyrate hydrolase family protein [Rhodococcus pseudokoreensis]
MSTGPSIDPITLGDVLPEGAGHGCGPLITVVVPLNFPGLTTETRSLVVRFTRSALTMLVELGARVDVIDISRDAPFSIDEEAGGVMLLGGGDVDPTLYGHTGFVGNLYGVDRGTDERTLAAIDAGLGLEVPILGICRGSQMINLACGGTLIPDLGEHNIHRGRDGEPMFLDDTVILAEDSRLARILSRSRMIVRNGHHQAVNEVGAGLRVVARGVDGVVEAVEHESKWIVGVQWHPEDTDGSAEDREALFRSFVEHSTAHAAAKCGSRTTPAV